jgi:hypothetical protein
MKAKLLGLVACMALISMSQASAATMVGTTINATGIDGLLYSRALIANKLLEIHWFVAVTCLW